MIHREDGFTLVEVLIGSVLSGLLLAALVGIFQTGYQSLRVSSDSYLGNDDVQLALRYLMPDVQGSTRTHLAVTTGPGGTADNTLTVGVPDPGQERLTSVTYVYSDLTGTITRTAASAGVPTQETVIARRLKTGLGASGTRFTYCATGPCAAIGGTGPKLRATLAFDINGTTVTREFDLSPRLTAP